jgi:hypothetical protein
MKNIGNHLEEKYLQQQKCEHGNIPSLQLLKIGGLSFVSIRFA